MAFLEDLAWLGIDWDEGPEYEGYGGGTHGPYFQSQRRDIYDRYLDRLLAEGKAYRAFETPEELDAARQRARGARVDYRYDRAALTLDQATVERLLAEGRPHVVRLKVPDVNEVMIRDELLGEVRVSGEEIDDFVIRKADGYPTFHFAVVVDDQLMGITHVIRGNDHLKNTARHMLLQNALGFVRPTYVHMSLTMNVDGSKVSKRDKDKALRRFVEQHGIVGSSVVADDTWRWWLGDKDHQLGMRDAEQLAEELGVHLPEIDIDDFRKAGYLPEVMVNFLVLLGWSPGGDIEQFDRVFLTENFGIEGMIKSSSKFDREKLLAFNLDALRAMPGEAFLAYLREHAERYHRDYLQVLDDERFRLFAACNQARSKTLEDPFRSCRFLLMDDDAIVYEPTKAVRKALVRGEPCGFDHLAALREVLAQVSDWQVGHLEQAIGTHAEQSAGGNLGKVAQPLRVAVTGGTVSPGIFETLSLLGRDAVLARIDRCLSMRPLLVAAG
jgi:glutamyl-tRNA synthetase